MLVILVATLGFVVYMQDKKDDVDVATATYTFLGVIFGLVALEFATIFFWVARFRKRLIQFVEELNREVLHMRGVHLYYNDGWCGCCGKNIGRLGIRRHEEGSPLVPRN